jgi:hypothetical protein
MSRKHRAGDGQTAYRIADYYDKQGKPLDEEGWTRKRADPEYRRVASTVLPDGKRVSTIWIGLDYAFGRGPPLIFETMVFTSEDSGYDDEIERYSTEKEALEGHKHFVEKWSKAQQ